MNRKRVIIIIFAALTVANLLVFFFRDHFQYTDFRSPDELYALCNKSCSESWARYLQDYPASELKAAKQFTDTLVQGAEKDTKEKVIRLSIFIYNAFHSRMGKPTEELLKASPYRQLKMLAETDSLQVWCGNLAEMFSFLCWSQNITCRTIEVMKEGDHHVLNECFLPDEGKWAVVDLTHNFILPEKDLVPVGFAALRGVDSIKGWRISGNLLYPEMIKDTGFLAGYYHPFYPAFYYFRINNQSVYTVSAKFRRYILPVSWYAVLDKHSETNFLFYLKDILLLFWLVSFFVLFTSRTKFRA
jgi:hypothetical protein